MRISGLLKSERSDDRGRKRYRPGHAVRLALGVEPKNGKKMSIVLIIIGFLIARFGASIFFTGDAQGGQSTGAGLITLIIQVAGWGLMIWGLIRLFS